MARDQLNTPRLTSPFCPLILLWSTGLGQLNIGRGLAAPRGTALITGVLQQCRLVQPHVPLAVEGGQVGQDSVDNVGAHLGH